MDFALDPLTSLRAAVIAVAALAFIAFACSAVHVFPAFARDRAAERPAWVYTVRVVGLLLALWHLRTLLLHAADDARWLGLALGLYLASLGLFLWARWTIGRHLSAPTVSFLVPERLVSVGAYGLVRHPLYASYLYAWIAGCVATFDLTLISVTLWLAALMIAAALHEERTFDRSPCQSHYAVYRRRAGMFVPRLDLDVGRRSQHMVWSDAEGEPPADMQVTSR